MKIRFIILVLLVVSLSITSAFAANNLEPKDSTDTLLIGRITLTPLFNDLRCSKITFLNKDTQKYYYAAPDKMGFFFILNPDSGYYSLEVIENARKNTTIGNWKVGLPLSNIQIQPGKVFNLGSLKGVFRQDPKIANTYNHIIVQDYSPEELKSMFAEKFPDSLWLKKEWVNIQLNIPNE